MMGLYRKKPVVIEAMQFTNDTKDQVFNWVTCNRYAGYTTAADPCLRIQTLEGEMTAHLGDWVIKGVKGEFYPCKADIFEATYEAIETEALRQQLAAPQPDANGLLSCPFCGSEAQITEHKSASLRTVYMVSCVACEDECSKQSHEREQAIVAWNRRTPQPLLCERCNDYLEAPSYCEVCYGTIESAWKEAEAKVAPQPPAPSVPTDAIRYCWRWAQLYAEKAEDEARYNFMCEQIDKVVQWVEPTPSALAAQPSAPA